MGLDLGREAPIELFQQMGTHDNNGNIPGSGKKAKNDWSGCRYYDLCATSMMLVDIGGVYCENADVAVLDSGNIEHRYDEPATLYGVQPYSLNEMNAKRLWQLSEEMTGVEFRMD